MEIWFTSDTHFGHRNIIELSKRPFGSMEEHDEKLIENWNSRVARQDTVYHLGDFALAPVAFSIPILRKLNGNKILVFGNHDHKTIKKNRGGEIGSLFGSMHDIHEIKVPDSAISGGKRRIVMCHFPMMSWNQMHRGSWMLHGHCHGSLPADMSKLRLDVGVDCWNYMPVHLDQLREEMAKRAFTPIDHHGAD